MIAVAALVLAAGYYVPETGTVARAKGGAYAAMSGDPLVLVFNPAGIAGANQELLVDFTVLYLAETFSRTDIAADSTAGTKATNAPPPQIVPNILYTHPIGDKLVIGGGLHAPAGPRWKFKDRGPQRYSLSELWLVEASVGVGASYRVHRTFAVGLELQNMIHQVQHRLYVTNNAPPSAPTEADANDTAQELDVLDTFTPNAVIGILVTPMEGLDFGLSYRPPTEASCEGTLTPTGLDPYDVTFEFAVASILRAGARYSKPAWDVELDFVMEDWSKHSHQTLTSKSGSFLIPSEGGKIVVPREFDTAYSVRLGGSWAASPKLRVLGGFFHETAAVPDNRLEPGSFDADKQGINLGATWNAGRFSVTGAYTHVLMATRTITNNENRQQSPFDLDSSDPDDPDKASYSVIGNGKYSGGYDMLGLSLATRF